eukprot:Selendium_serpulae@DN6339_c2_g1_i3.p1
MRRHQFALFFAAAIATAQAGYLGAYGGYGAVGGYAAPGVRPYAAPEVRPGSVYGAYAAPKAAVGGFNSLYNAYAAPKGLGAYAAPKGPYGPYAAAAIKGLYNKKYGAPKGLYGGYGAVGGFGPVPSPGGLYGGYGAVGGYGTVAAPRGLYGGYGGYGVAGGYGGAAALDVAKRAAFICGFRHAFVQIREQLVVGMQENDVQSVMANIINIDVDGPLSVFGANAALTEIDATANVSDTDGSVSLASTFGLRGPPSVPAVSDFADFPGEVGLEKEAEQFDPRFADPRFIDADPRFTGGLGFFLDQPTFGLAAGPITGGGAFIDPALFAPFP